jgi:REP element-mobilizing transposase RayT
MGWLTHATHVCVHFVWATWNRAAFLTPELEERIYDCVTRKSEETRRLLLAIGGTENHVHVLVRLHSMVSVAQLAHGMKGSSSHLTTHVLAADQPFKWQGTYGAFSVGENDVDRVRTYIKMQKEHHARGNLVPDWERCMEIPPKSASREPNL